MTKNTIMMQSWFIMTPVKYVIAEVMVSEIIVSFRQKLRDNTVQSSQCFQTSLLHQLTAVHHFDWQLRGGLWRADESKKPISASEATAAVLCSPAHLPPPPPALLPASHCRLQALLTLLPAANKTWTSSYRGTVLFKGPRMLCLCLRIVNRRREESATYTCDRSNRCILKCHKSV